MKALACERVRELLHYDPDTGIVRWRVNRDRAGRAKAGDIVGRPDKDGYLKFTIESSSQYLHRVIWLYVTGHWPDERIDHRDGDPVNNRWANLREATPSQNGANRRLASNNRLGIKGVREFHGKYRATIMLNGEAIHLGTFNTPQEAAKVRALAARDLHGEYARVA